jgi:hypothetical protein
MSSSIILLPSTSDKKNVIGDPVHADGWYGFSEGLHTVSIHTANFTGRIWIQASLALEPTEDDWFDIWLREGTPYLEFPFNPSAPTGYLQGDTTNMAFTFKANILWVRAKMDRDYLEIVEPYDGSYGVINKIVLSR